ncbi:MAG: hypothetical protein HFE78_03215 [Clostridiales bacterium]|nr:hypothetical protein [Clostridiales bacterium]
MFKVDNFSCYCSCSTYNLKRYHTACNELSYCFTPNIYILKGDIDMGALAFVCAISDKKSNVIWHTSPKLQLEDQEIPVSKAHTIACQLDIYNGYRKSEKNITFYNAIQRKIKKHHFVVSAEQLFEDFDVPEHMIHRKIRGLGNFYWPVYRAMSGLVEGKKVFTTQWFGRYGFNSFVLERTGRALVRYGCILIVPSSARNEFSEDCISLEMASLFNHPELREKYGN